MQRYKAWQGGGAYPVCRCCFGLWGACPSPSPWFVAARACVHATESKTVLPCLFLRLFDLLFGYAEYHVLLRCFCVRRAACLALARVAHYPARSSLVRMRVRLEPARSVNALARKSRGRTHVHTNELNLSAEFRPRLFSSVQRVRPRFLGVRAAPVLEGFLGGSAQRGYGACHPRRLRPLLPRLRQGQVRAIRFIVYAPPPQGWPAYTVVVVYSGARPE